MTQFYVSLEKSAFIPQICPYNPLEEAMSASQLFMKNLRADGVVLNEWSKLQIQFAFQRFFIQLNGNPKGLQWTLERVCGRSVDISDLVPRDGGALQPITPECSGPRIVSMRTLIARSGRQPKAIGSERRAQSKKM